MGDAADRLFLILSGEVVCHREGGEKELQRLSQGNFFGESALGGSTDGQVQKRFANVVAVGSVRVASLKTLDMEQVLGPLTELLKRNFNRRVVDSVPLLGPLMPADKDDLLAVLQDVSCDAGHTIISQGAVGTTFYMIKSGSVEVFKESEGQKGKEGEGEACQLITTLKSGGYFGERALLTLEPCSATVVAAEATQLMTLDKAAFERVLGPLQNLIAREVEQREAQAARFNSSRWVEPARPTARASSIFRAEDRVSSN